ncbi:glycosyltransferase family 2 protein [Spirosoma sp. KUDC1026]|uniref:glycosyltransferase family 2 protein n=1 Tax=Spirosoma sp. KUDC1026 TaxID=2745947 RepID=UPI00159BBA0D|nr:glycosyltransferase family 2 protein [Spirosoma sp. KUDC1026]QKZ14599.1 glycosyltransferase family 2 protein [Spirosoma sp. KUDC1026]
MDLSIVIPVYNSEHTISPLVERLHTCLAGRAFEVILVNDGSPDRSESVCRQLAAAYKSVQFISLRRNFGEFNAVLCGLNHASGQHVVIIDDDFQNPPESILTLVETADMGGYDVVYSRYEEKQHHWFRNLGSGLVNWLTTYSLGKPRELYLSSFKLIRREIVSEIIRYRGPYPYIDGLIFRVTRHVGSVVVPHNTRQEGRSNYTARKLIALFLNVFIGYSLWPVRIFTVVGAGLFLTSLLAGLGLLAGSICELIDVPNWIILLWAIAFATGLLLLCLGVLGEYVGKLFMAYSGLPPYVEKRNWPETVSRAVSQSSLLFLLPLLSHLPRCL